MKWYWGIFFAFSLTCLTGCSIRSVSTEKVKDLSYELVEEPDIPEEMREPISRRQKEPFLLTYADNGRLYIARGYGEQETDGYEIQVLALYESENAIVLKTAFLGPEPDAEVSEEPACPYIVVQTEYSNKYVMTE